MTDQENAAASRYFRLISNVPRSGEHTWLNRQADRTLALQCSSNDTSSGNPVCKQSPKNISYKNVVWDASETLGTKKKKKNGEEGRNETRSTRPASLQQPPPSKVYNHTPSHRHAGTGTITHTHSRVGNSRKAGTMPQPPPKNLAGLDRKSTRWHCSILDNKLGWQGVCIYIHIHTCLSSPHTEHVSLFFHRYAYIYIYLYFKKSQLGVLASVPYCLGREWGNGARGELGEMKMKAKGIALQQPTWVGRP